MTTKISIQLLGGFEISCGSAAGTLELPPKAARLLVYLLLHRDTWFSRETLIEAFWPDRPLEQARSSLNSTLWRLQKSLPRGTEPLVIGRGRDALALRDGSDLSIDADAFTAGVIIKEGALGAGEETQLRKALSLYRGELLPGWYDDWLLVERERLRHLHVVGLHQLMTHCERSKAYEQAIAVAQQLLAIEPLRESVHQSLMTLYMRTGNRAAALKQYATCTALLEAELGVRPMRETRELYARLLPADRQGPRQRTADDRNRPETDRLLTLRRCLDRLHSAQAALEDALESIDRPYAS